MNFEKIAASLKWPEEIWTMLLQSVLIGKAQEIYSAPLPRVPGTQMSRKPL